MSLLSPSVLSVQAKEKDMGRQAKYVENYYDISFEDLEVLYSGEGSKVKIEVKDGCNWLQRRKAVREKEKVEFLMERYDDGLEELLVETVEEGKKNGNEFIGMSYTECPLVMNEEGHLVRIAANNSGDDEKGSLIKEASAKSASGAKAYKYYFSLYTTVSRNSTKDSKNRYTYTCQSKGVWSANSALSGKKYPASGNDYILQSVPNVFSRTSDYLTVEYNNGLTAMNGTHYSRENGNSSYVRYSVVDDPLGLAQLSRCTLTAKYKAKAGTGRMVNSYYIHTWKKMSLSVTVSGDTSKAVGLSVTPSISNKSWQVYSYVSFDF